MEFYGTLWNFMELYGTLRLGKKFQNFPEHYGTGLMERNNYAFCRRLFVLQMKTAEQKANASYHSFAFCGLFGRLERLPVFRD